VLSLLYIIGMVLTGTALYGRKCKSEQEEEMK